MTPATSLRMVDLPEPLGPMIPRVSPRLTVKLISERAVKSLWVCLPVNRAGRNSLKVLWFWRENSLVTFLNSIIGFILDVVRKDFFFLFEVS